MNNSATEKRVSRARRLLADLTPLQTDCGALCGGACCKGDEGTGMLLFPGEDTPFRVLTADTLVWSVFNANPGFPCNKSGDFSRIPLELTGL